MQKKYVLIGIGIIILFIIIVAYSAIVSSFKNTVVSNTNSNNPDTIQKPDQNTTNNGTTTFAVVSSEPQRNATGVALQKNISITFNQQLSSDYTFTIVPDVAFKQTVANNKLTITFNASLQPSTLYSWGIKSTKTNEYIYTSTFTTLGPIPTLMPDTKPQGAAQAEEDFQKTNHPDVFLANKTPYETTTFSVTNDFKTGSPAGHYFFTVTLKSANKDAAKNDFINWLKSLGLTDQEIATLDIEQGN